MTPHQRLLAQIERDRPVTDAFAALECAGLHGTLRGKRERGKVFGQYMQIQDSAGELVGVIHEHEIAWGRARVSHERMRAIMRAFDCVREYWNREASREQEKAP